MRGIVRFAGYVPYRRLDRASIPAFLGSGGGKGTRAVASHDEDTTTLGVEALRAALGGGPGAGRAREGDAQRRLAAKTGGGTSGGGDTTGQVGALWFATATPAYLDKANAAAVHAAAGLAPDVPAFDFGGSLRSGIGALISALRGGGGAGTTTAVVLADMRDGLPASTDESAGGDAAAAFLIGDDAPGAPVVAEFLGAASVTEEFLDRWRAPGERRSKTWEDRFGETRYLGSGKNAWGSGLANAGLTSGDVTRVTVTGMHARAVAALVKKLGVATDAVADDLSSTVGQAGSAHPGLVLAALLEEASPGQVIAVVHLADGADAMFFRTTHAIPAYVPARPVAAQIAQEAPLPYAKFLTWRGMLTPEPPRRPEPARVSSPAAWRSNEWKYGFTGSADRTSGAVHLPPSRVSMTGGAFDDMEAAPRSGARGTIATFTVDRLAYSPSPPIIFAVVDFEGGGRFPVELTDCDESEIAIGTQVEMTFRRLFSADGIHDYFWKARPAREDGKAGGAHGEGPGAGSGGRGPRDRQDPPDIQGGAR